MKYLLLVLVLLFGLGAPAQAQVWTNAQVFPWNYVALTTTTVTVVKNSAGVLGGVMSTGVQTNSVTCYDNASAASGTILAVQLLGSVGAAISGIPSGGISATNGITCQVPTAIFGTVIVYYR